MYNDIKMFTRAEETEKGKGKISKVIEYGTEHRIVIPINPDGTVKWFDDAQLIRKGK